ncbi:MAG: hypothetical protein AB7U73_01085 [Pirellulales bacterium]
MATADESTPATQDVSEPTADPAPTPTPSAPSPTPPVPQLERLSDLQNEQVKRSIDLLEKADDLLYEAARELENVGPLADSPELAQVTTIRATLRRLQDDINTARRNRRG